MVNGSSVESRNGVHRIWMAVSRMPDVPLCFGLPRWGCFGARLRCRRCQNYVRLYVHHRMRYAWMHHSPNLFLLLEVYSLPRSVLYAANGHHYIQWGHFMCFLSRTSMWGLHAFIHVVHVVEPAHIGTVTMLLRWKLKWGCFFTTVYPSIVASSVETYGYLAFKFLKTTIWPAPSRKCRLPASSCGVVHDKLPRPQTFQPGDG